ncbi:hypothetical protein ACUXCC_003660 [Cytobacillus horneckiae]|uniref:hypothetical protein n=1 Tax=Cytobacillus horneckiae TaxID=549687 RepID=UPI0019D11053|nr:hypothetical protein [Cytobacillus horneckiae]MBN6888698.1 hypothetical protein [Cytobacillus horneckiae]
MKLIIDSLFFIIIGFYTYQFILVLLKMKQNITFPMENEELEDIRIYPQKSVNFPSYQEQKWSIISYGMILLFVVSMYVVGVVTGLFNWSFYLLLFLPLSYSYSLLNMFFIVEDGIVGGSRFLPWRKIKSFDFVPIDINHRYYGHSKEVNGGYELKLKSGLHSISLIVTSSSLKEKISVIFNKYVSKRSEG